MQGASCHGAHRAGGCGEVEVRERRRTQPGSEPESHDKGPACVSLVACLAPTPPGNHQNKLSPRLQGKSVQCTGASSSWTIRSKISLDGHHRSVFRSCCLAHHFLSPHLRPPTAVVADDNLAADGEPPAAAWGWETEHGRNSGKTQVPSEIR